MSWDPEDSRQRSGAVASQLLGVVDEEFMQKYHDAGEAVGEVLIHLLQAGVPPKVAAHQVLALANEVACNAWSLMTGFDFEKPAINDSGKG